MSQYFSTSWVWNPPIQLVFKCFPAKSWHETKQRHQKSSHSTSNHKHTPSSISMDWFKGNFAGKPNT